MINTIEETVEAAEISSAKQTGRDRYQHINSLINNGLSVDEIAKVTGLSRGEIELIRNLKK
jgi:DNA-binding NarL/FixJ family response regulator